VKDIEKDEKSHHFLSKIIEIGRQKMKTKKN
jgi:hypothetical protein